MQRGDKAKVFLRCTSASATPIIAVVAKLRGEHRRWSCVLKWDVRRKAIQEGAWTTLQLRESYLRLSPDGEFLHYGGRGGYKRPFDVKRSGAVAVSRLPWLSALTDIRMLPFGVPFKSDHALSDAEQQELWGMFLAPHDDANAALRGKPVGSWQSAAVTDAEEFACFGVPSGVSLGVFAKRGLQGVGGAIWCGMRRKYGDGRVYAYHDRHGQWHPMPGAHWVEAGLDETLLAACNDGCLRQFRIKRGRNADTIVCVQEHDLNGLKPNPGPSPAEARRGLKPLRSNATRPNRRRTRPQHDD